MRRCTSRASSGASSPTTSPQPSGPSGFAVRKAARRDLPEELHPRPTVKSLPGTYLYAQLRRWSRACPRPLVLVFDEIDSLSGEPLKSVLGQLRAVYGLRPREAPWSAIFCGMRSDCDYKMARG